MVDISDRVYIHITGIDVHNSLALILYICRCSLVRMFPVAGLLVPDSVPVIYRLKDLDLPLGLACPDV